LLDSGSVFGVGNRFDVKIHIEQKFDNYYMKCIIMCQDACAAKTELRVLFFADNDDCAFYSRLWDSKSNYITGCWMLLHCHEVSIVLCMSDYGFGGNEYNIRQRHSPLTRQFVSCVPRDVAVSLRNANPDFASSFPHLLANGGGGLLMHKSALCAESDVFKAMFTSGMSEEMTGTLTLMQQYSEQCGTDVLIIFCLLAYEPNCLLTLNGLREIAELYTSRQAQNDKKRQLQLEEEPSSSEAVSICWRGTKSVGDTQGGLYYALEEARGIRCCNGHFDWIPVCLDCCAQVNICDISWEDSPFIVDHLETIWFPVFDLLHQYRCHRALHRLTLLFLSTLQSKSLLLYYDFANRYEVEPLQRACAILGSSIVGPKHRTFVDTAVIPKLDAPWSAAKHSAFADFVRLSIQEKTASSDI
jgi:hypothetical protein